jgi:hypothetical protein
VWRAGFALILAVVAIGCADNDGASAVTRQQGAVVFGTDDRLDYNAALDSKTKDRLAKSTVALIPNTALDRSQGRLLSPPSFGESQQLCAGEQFFEQPSVAFCSGVLVDWDLVLTAGHCTRVLGLSQFSVVFDYYYATDTELALGPHSVGTPVEIVAEALDPNGPVPRRDYAWLRLQQPAPPGHEPAPLRTRTALNAGDPIVTIGAPHGLPMKIDPHGAVQDPRATGDYFLVHADVSSGWSGGGAFDADLDLLGVLARGSQTDLVLTDAGCYRELTVPDDDPLGEEFSYTASALEGLCGAGSQSSLCRSDCPEPCVALPQAVQQNPPEASGCSVAQPGRRAELPSLFSVLLGIGFSLTSPRGFPRRSLRSATRKTSWRC